MNLGEMYSGIAACFIYLFINGFSIKYKSKKFIAKKPEQEPGYKKLIKGMIVYEWIPIVIMTIGILFGMTENLLEYFRPKLMNPFVLFFHFVCILQIIITARWIFFKNGAEFVAKHPGIIPGYWFGGGPYDAKGYRSFFSFRLKVVAIFYVLLWIV